MGLSFVKWLRYLSGSTSRDCSVSDNPALYCGTIEQHRIGTLKDTRLSADHPGLTSTFSTFWIRDSMPPWHFIPSSSTHSSISKDRPSRILFPANASSSSQIPLNGGRWSKCGSNMSVVKSRAFKVRALGERISRSLSKLRPLSNVKWSFSSDLAFCNKYSGIV